MMLEERAQSRESKQIQRKDNSLLKRLSLILIFACFNWIDLDHWPEKQGLVHTTQVNHSAFGWLATSEVKHKKLIFFQIVTDKVGFGAICSTCVVYTQKQVFTLVSVKLVDIYIAALRFGKNLPLFTTTSTLVNS